MIKQDVINNSCMIFGAFSPGEMSVLYDYAIKCGRGANFVEIGSYFGRSSSLLGQVAKENDCHLTCIDIFVTKDQDGKSPKLKFIENMARFDLEYELMEISSDKASEIYDREIDLLFIDGSHKYEWVKKDCQLWLPKLTPGRFVLFHDYVGSWVGVKQAVDEETAGYKNMGIMESLIVKQKPIE